MSSELEIADIMSRVRVLVKKLPAALTKADLSILSKMPSSWKKLSSKLGVELVTLL